MCWLRRGWWLLGSAPGQCLPVAGPRDSLPASGACRCRESVVSGSARVTAACFGNRGVAAGVGRAGLGASGDCLIRLSAGRWLALEPGEGPLAGRVCRRHWRGRGCSAHGEAFRPGDSSLPQLVPTSGRRSGVLRRPAVLAAPEGHGVGASGSGDCPCGQPMSHQRVVLRDSDLRGSAVPRLAGSVGAAVGEPVTRKDRANPLMPLIGGWGKSLAGGAVDPGDPPMAGVPRRPMFGPEPAPSSARPCFSELLGPPDPLVIYRR